jgi:RNA recognition motif-containing protein
LDNEGKELEVNKRLYVGNLSYNTTEGGLRTLFSDVGSVVEVTILFDSYTGRSRGFGFVEMADETTAEKAVSELNGKELDGRALRVAEARPRRQRRDSYSYSTW